MTAFDWNLILRLFVAGMLGGLIGLEREIRAKEAGVRTHFIVALGSALFMIISQYGFEGATHFDASRVAAQVVSGIGFIGAGVIIFQRNTIRGVTTASGLWATAAIGMACGAAMYPVAVATVLLTIGVLEMMHFVNNRLAEKVVMVTLTPLTDTGHPEADLPERIEFLSKRLESYAFEDGKVRLSIRMPQRKYFAIIEELHEALKDAYLIDSIN